MSGTSFEDTENYIYNLEERLSKAREKVQQGKDASLTTSAHIKERHKKTAPQGVKPDQSLHKKPSFPTLATTLKERTVSVKSPYNSTTIKTHKSTALQQSREATLKSAKH